MRKWKQKLWTLLALISIVLFQTLPVLAATNVDMSQNGTGELTVVLRTKEDEPVGIQDAEFAIYMVEELKEKEDGAQTSEWTTDFADCGITTLQNMNASELSEAAKTLASYVNNKKMEGTKQSTDSSGYAVYKNLTFGTYLVVLTQVPDTYETTDPFLISVPLEEDGELTYKVFAAPKIGKLSTPEPTEEPTPTPEPTGNGTENDDQAMVPTTEPSRRPLPYPTDDPVIEPTKEPTPEPTLAPTATPTPPPEKLPQTGQPRYLIPVLFICSLVVFVAGWILLRKKPGKFLMFGGIIIFAAMIGCSIYQNHNEQVSDKAAEEMRVAYEAAMEEEDIPVQTGNIETADETEVTIPYVEVADEKCIGEIAIPAIDITLPVIRDCTSAGLKKAPCRYVGSTEDNSLIIAAHNYERHFGKISHLKAGDKVTFTDVQGIEYSYEVRLTETLGPYDVEKMKAGDWDLTLFTCTYGGQKRVTVRCSLVSSV